MPPSQHIERPSPAIQTAASLPAPAAGQGVGTILIWLSLFLGIPLAIGLLIYLLFNWPVHAFVGVFVLGWGFVCLRLADYVRSDL